MAYIFHNISKECFNWLKSQPHVKEESLTDWLLYTLSKETDRIYYKAFTRNEEAYNGTDWEWWIIENISGRFHAYRFLVQAKKLKENQDNYPIISYGNRNGLQIDLLIGTALENRAMPVYLYYSCSKPEIKEQVKNFSFVPQQMISWCKDCINGVYLSSSYRIKSKIFDIPRYKLYDVDLLNNSLKFSAFDLLFNDIHNMQYILNAINNHYISNIVNKNNNISRENTIKGIKYTNQDIPPYLSSIISHDSQGINWIESQFTKSLNGLSGVGIIDLRDLNKQR